VHVTENIPSSIASDSEKYLSTLKKSMVPKVFTIESPNAAAKAGEGMVRL
jgi:hypothetical protein